MMLWKKPVLPPAIVLSDGGISVRMEEKEPWEFYHQQNLPAKKVEALEDCHCRKCEATRHANEPSEDVEDGEELDFEDDDFIEEDLEG